MSEDFTVKVWQEFKPGNKEGIATEGKDASWKCISTLSGYHPRAIYDVDWCHKTNLIVTACGDNAIRVFKESPSCSSDPLHVNFELLHTQYKAHNEDVNSVRWNLSKPGLLASCSDDSSVKLWQVVEE